MSFEAIVDNGWRRADDAPQTSNDHNSSPWAFGLSELKINPEDPHLAWQGWQSDENGDPEGLIFLSHPHTNNGLFFLLTIKYSIFIFETHEKGFHYHKACTIGPAN